MKTVSICQGPLALEPKADLVIVVDVIRAFTLTHVAMERGAARVRLVDDAEAAARLRASSEPTAFLAGEIGGLKIPGFDFGNSPEEICRSDLTGRTLILRTTNGVRSAVSAHRMGPRHIFVCGLVNAESTAVAARDLADPDVCNILINASHPDGDDDLAVAEYIRGVILGHSEPTLAQARQRVINSPAAKKFYDPTRPEFDVRDMDHCLGHSEADYVLRVGRETPPTIEKYYWR